MNQLDNNTHNQKYKCVVRFDISSNPNILLKIKQRLIFYQNLNLLENRTHNQKYQCISENTKNLFFLFESSKPKF